MRISFQFAPDKATQAIAYILRALSGQEDKVKLMKLLYIADRDNFILHGAPITGDDQYAMPHGPVPSGTLNLINGEYPDFAEPIYDYIGLNDYRVCLKQDPGEPLLRHAEIQTLDRVIAQHGDKHTWSLVGETHEYPEYKEHYRANTSRLIPYESILKHYNKDAVLHNRPVISRNIARQMRCPFTKSEPDL